MKTCLLALTLLTASMSVAVAQTPTPAPSAPPLPSGPLLKPAPEFSRWTVAYTYVTESEKEQPGVLRMPLPPPESRPVRTVTTCTGPIIHEQTYIRSGEQLENWFNGSMQYFKPASKPDWKVGGGTRNDAVFAPMPASRFRGADWITADNYAGTVDLGQGAYMVFVPGGYHKVNLSGGNPKKLLEGQKTLAYVDAMTRTLYMMRVGDTVTTYHFEDPPTQMQKLPDDLQGQIKQGEAATKRLLQAAPRPY